MLQAVANPAYLSPSLFYALPILAGCCALVDARVVSAVRGLGVASSFAIHMRS
jgi:hypothetical protein